MKSHLWVSMVAEIVAIIVFGALAYLFRKWWIALFAMLWIRSYSFERKHSTNNGESMDETKLTEVIYNFLSNAVKHTPEGKTIYLRAFRLEDEETVRVEVEDEGEGIPEEEIPFIWDRYQKSSRSFSRSMSSTGLGLSIVKAILDSHHARYGVTSQQGKGSLFWFELHNPDEVEEEG